MNYITQEILNLSWLRQDSREYRPMFYSLKIFSQSTSINYKVLS
jgi:hypothetical protein